MKQILIIEDDKKLNDGIRLALRSEYVCIQAFSLSAAREMLQVQKPDLILLDVNLPDGSGMDFLTEFRKTDQIPVILLTANKMEMDIVMGLESGANDYITKPFSLMVLRARVGVQLRQIKTADDVFQNDEYCFDFAKMEFQKGGKILDLSKTEQKLLRCLIENRGRSISRNQLIDEVWQGDTEFVDEHALTVAVNRLRKKLDDSSNQPEYIKTVYGIGYTWAK